MTQENLIEVPIEKTKSTIEWQTGKPTQFGTYLVTTAEGFIDIDIWYAYANSEDWYEYGSDNSEKVRAWCKLSDIEPYKD